MNQWNASNLILTLYVLLYPLGMAVLLHLALRANRFGRGHALAGMSLAGFLLGAGSNLALTRVLSGFDEFSVLLVGQTAIAGLITAWRLFAIAYIWTDHAENFWGTALLAGLLMMESGPLGLHIVAAAISQTRAWLSVGWSFPFFVIGALTHGILRVGVPPEHHGYYRLSVGRMLLVLLLVPLTALLSWCTSAVTFGYRIVP